MHFKFMQHAVLAGRFYTDSIDTDTGMQHLNCKILHGGTLLQPWPNAFGMRKYFSKDYIIPSPKLNEHQKQKGLCRKLKCFFAKTRWRPTKKKVFAGNWSGFSPKLGEELGLFCLIIQRSNLDERTPKSRWGDANSRLGDVSPLQFKYCRYVTHANQNQKTSSAFFGFYFPSQYGTLTRC